MISKKDLSEAEMDTLTKSCSPTMVITANGEAQTHEEAIVYVQELDIFLTLKILEDTSAVLSLGKVCEDHGYSYEWFRGQKPCPGALRVNRGPWFINDLFPIELVYSYISDIMNARN